MTASGSSRSPTSPVQVFLLVLSVAGVATSWVFFVGEWPSAASLMLNFVLLVMIITANSIRGRQREEHERLARRSFLSFPAKVVRLHREEPLATYLVNRKVGSLRPVGGRLYLTTHRVLFLPHREERVLAAKEWSALGGDVVGARVVDRDGFDLLGKRERLSIAVRGESADEVFAVTEPHTVVEDVQRWRLSFVD
ncbi:hypothetical protein ACWGRK_14520 [Saccharomonospora azurea]